MKNFQIIHFQIEKFSVFMSILPIGECIHLHLRLSKIEDKKSSCLPKQSKASFFSKTGN